MRLPTTPLPRRRPRAQRAGRERPPRRAARRPCSKEKRGLRQELKEQEISQQEVIRQLKVDQAKELTKLRQEFEQTAKDLQLKCGAAPRGCAAPGLVFVGGGGLGGGG